MIKKNISVMKTITGILLFLISGIIPVSVSAQEKQNKKLTITGTVRDANKRPVMNAMVMIDGNTTDVVTREDGTYEITVKSKALKIGVFSFGTGLLVEDIAGRNVIDFNYSLKAPPPQEFALTASSDIPVGEVSVNTGYNKVKKKNLTNSVSKVKPGESKRTYSSIFEMLQGIAGLEVRGGNVIIQDSRNMNGHVPPLFVVDGVPVTSIDGISPSTVESIEVLKGTSAAIYGSRGFGGAILISTKVAGSKE
jgi:TonB-dependent SusC/RagA subfamily outer membrane receptor